jgi:hypothetical protein
MTLFLNFSVKALKKLWGSLIKLCQAKIFLKYGLYYLFNNLC